MSWNRNPHRETADQMEDLSHPPSGGRIKMIVRGVVLPLVVFWFAAEAWIDQEAWWFGHHNGSNVKLRGDAARGMAACWAGVAGFLHFRYFWGLWPAPRLFSIGVVLSIILGLGGCGAALYHELM